jgi:lipopolysaccharide export system permease protein
MYVSVLSRYLIKTYLEKLFLVLLVVVFALVLSSAFDILHRIKGVNLQYKIFLQLIFLKVPYLTLELLPLIVMLATFLTHFLLSRRNELLMMCTSGVSIYRILMPIIIANIAIGIIGITALNPLSTYALIKYETLDAKVTDRKMPYLVLSNLGVMIAENYNHEHRIYVARSVLVQENKMLNVSVFFMDANNNFDSRIEAESVSFGNNELIMRNVYIFRHDSKVSVQNEYVLPSSLMINNLIDGVTPPDYLDFWKLPDAIMHLSQAGFPTFKHQLYYYKLLFRPLSIVGYIIFAMCFISHNNRGKNKVNVIAIGILSGIFLYLISQQLSNILAYNGLGTMLSVSIPIIIVILGANLLLLHLRT